MALPPQRKGKLKFLVQDVYFMSWMSNVKREFGFRDGTLRLRKHTGHLVDYTQLTQGLGASFYARWVTTLTKSLTSNVTDKRLGWRYQLRFRESRDKHHTSTAVLYDSTIHDWMCTSFNAKTKRKPKNAQDHNNSFRTLEEMYRCFTNKGYGMPFKGHKMIRDCS